MLRTIIVACALAMTACGDAPTGDTSATNAVNDQPEAPVPTSIPSPAATDIAPSEAASEQVYVPTRQDLENRAYDLGDTGTAALQDGTYTDGTTTVTLADAHQIADLDGDGERDAVVVLNLNFGGSGTFVNLRVLRNIDGALHDTKGLTYIGDRVIVESLRSKGRRVKVGVRYHGPDDGLCCPTMLDTRTFRVKDLVAGDATPVKVATRQTDPPPADDGTPLGPACEQMRKEGVLDRAFPDGDYDERTCTRFLTGDGGG